MKEQLIDFETAKLAKEKGFDQRKKAIIGKYREDGTIQRGGPSAAVCDKNIEWYEAPTQSLLQKWLRELHNINIVIHTFKSIENLKMTSIPIGNKYYCWDIFEYPNVSLGGDFKTFEQALEEGLIEALKLIKTK